MATAPACTPGTIAAGTASSYTVGGTPKIFSSGSSEFFVVRDSGGLFAVSAIVHALRLHRRGQRQRNSTAPATAPPSRSTAASRPRRRTRALKHYAMCVDASGNVTVDRPRLGLDHDPILVRALLLVHRACRRSPAVRRRTIRTASSPPAPPAQLLDYNEFVCEVQPVLVRRCSFLACHGNADHALRVYSPGKLRLVDSAMTTRSARDAKLSRRRGRAQLRVGHRHRLLRAAEPIARIRDDRVPHPASSRRAPRSAAPSITASASSPSIPRRIWRTIPSTHALAAWVAGKKATGNEPACADMFMKLGLNPQ